MSSVRSREVLAAFDSVLLFVKLHESAHCRFPRLLFRHAALEVFFYGEGDVCVQLFVKIRIERLPAEERGTAA